MQFQIDAQAQPKSEVTTTTPTPRKFFLVNNDTAFIDINGSIVISASQPELRREVARVSASYGGLRNSEEEHGWMTFREFSEGYAVIGWALCGRCRNPFWMEGFIDETGKLVIAPQNFEARYGDFHEGLARHYDRGWGFINREGQMIIKGQFYEVRDFSEGMAAVRSSEGGKFAFIDRRGKLVTPFQFDWASDFHDGLAAVKFNKDQNGYLDKTGKVILYSNDWRETNDFSEGLAAVRVEVTDNTVYRGYKTEKYGYIDRTGRFVIAPRLNWAPVFSEGRSLFFQTGQQHEYGFIEPTGKIVIEPQFVSGKSFSEGLASVAIKSSDGRTLWGYVDQAGKWVIEPQFQNANSFKGGLAAVNCDEYGRYCKTYIDRAGKIRWQSAEPPKH